MLASADQIEALLDQIHPYAYTAPGVEGQLQLAANPLLSVGDPAGVNLRNWAFELARDVGKTNPYGPAGFGVDLDLSSGLSQTRGAIAQTRAACSA